MSTSEIARFIPGDILYHICGATEDEDNRNIVDRKHRKNLNVLSMMDVCRSWNAQIRGMNGLLMDIAFDTSDHVTINTATRFLEIVKTRSTDLHVYARCLTWGINRAASQAFLSSLQSESWRFVSFQAEHLAPPFIAYFALPTPRLLRLIHTSTPPGRLFSSSFKALRVLNISLTNHFPWPTATLSKLAILRLENFHPARSFCATSLFDIIGRTHQLEELRLTDFLRFSGGSKAPPVVRANLKSIHFVQCNLKFILQHLRFPNAISLRVESYGVGLDGEPTQPPSRDVGYFTPVQAWPIPILEEQRVNRITTQTQDCFANNIYSTLGLKCEAGQTVDFTTTFHKGDDWEAYFRSSINEILRRVRLCTRVNLSTFHYPPLLPISPPLCQPPLSPLDLPLLRLSQVAVLRTDYSFVRGVVFHLADPGHGILPNLKCYSFDVETQPTSADLRAPETVAEPIQRLFCQ